MVDENRFSGLMVGLSSDDDGAKDRPSEKPEKRAASEAKKSKPLPKSKDPDYAQIGIYLPKEMHRKMKIGAAVTGLEMSEIAEQAIELWVKKNVPNS